MRLIVICFLWLAALASIGLAQSGVRVDTRDNFEFQFDDSHDLSSMGLSGSVEQLNPPGNGYHRYRITFKYGGLNPAGVATDTDIEFDLMLDGYSGLSPTCSVRLTIPKNTIIATTEVLIPVSSTSYRLTFRTKVNGELKPYLSGDERFPTYDFSNGSYVVIGNEYTREQIRTNPNIEFTSVASEASAAWSARFQQKKQGLPLPNNFYNESYNIRFALVDRLPTNCLDWTTVNKVISSVDILSQLNDQQALCLIEYLRGSGSLLVYGEAEGDEIKNQVSDWLAKYSQVNSDYWQKSWSTTDQESSLTFGIGAIHTVGQQSLYKLVSFEDFNLFTATNTPYAQDERLNRLRGQPFWNWYLTRLGQPPVGVFTLLIGCFAGIFAPALLIYCLRYNRTAWLLVIFPIIAIAGTVLMIVYASLHDGFGTYSRVRSMTLLDPNSDQGICVSRQVLFSGLTPREGLSFERDSEVWQIDAYEQGYSKNTNAGRLRWTEHQQIFEKVVTPREQFQFFVSQPIAKMQPFEWVQYPTAPSDPSSQPVCEIKNLLNETLSLVVIGDAAGNFFVTKGLSPGATSTMDRAEVSVVANMLKAQEDSQPLELPVGLRSGPSQSIVNSALGVRSRYYGGSYSTQSNDLMDETSKALIDRINLMKTKCFFVYPDSGTYVDRALQSSIEKDSLHMIYGRWENP